MERTESHEFSDLIARARHGDVGAMNELVRVHTDRLMDSIRAELGDQLRQRLESCDIMQQVYHDAIRDIDQFVDQGHGSFFAWLRRIALNRMADLDRQAFRAQKRQGELRAADLRELSMLRLLDQVAGSVTTPSGAADFADRVRLLQRALDQLGEGQCEVIQLRYLEQKSVAETAAQMGRTERAVRSLCVRALIRLREILGDAI